MLRLANNSRPVIWLVRAEYVLLFFQVFSRNIKLARGHVLDQGIEVLLEDETRYPGDV